MIASPRRPQVFATAGLPTLFTISPIAGWLAILTGLAVLTGWYFDIEFLKRLVPTLVAMNPTTATCFIALGIALVASRWRTRRRLCITASYTIGAVVTTVGAIKLIDLSTGHDSGIDRVVFSAKLVGASTLNMNAMAPNTALNMLLLGSAVLCLIRYRPNVVVVGQLLTGASIVFATMAIVGYAYGALSLYHVANFFPMALNTALTFVVVAIGLLARYPRRGLVAIVTRRDFGGTTARRLLLSVTAIPFLLGLVLVLGERTKLFQATTGIAAFVTANILVLVAIVLWLGNQLHHAAARLAARHAELTLANRRADAANQAKSNFLANMSHEIRTPMNGVLGMLEIIERTQLSDQQRRMVETIRGSGRSLLTIINDILDFSKIEAGQMKIDTVPCDVAELVEDIARLFLGAAIRKNIVLRCFVAPPVRGLFAADPVRLRQILSNLVSNAIKFTAVGHVTLYTTLSHDGDGVCWIEVDVADTGIGISADAQQRLFQPFTQGESSTTREFGGTGLGLSICRRLVDLMGGQIRLSSVLGRGTQIRLRLPTEQVEKSLEAFEPHDELVGARIVLLGGDEAERWHVTECLRYWGAQVHPARDLPVLATATDSTPLLLIGPADMLGEMRTQMRSCGADEADAHICRYVLYRHDQLVADLQPASDVIVTTALSRARLITAVAIAAGQRSPEVELVPVRGRAVEDGVIDREAAIRCGQLILVAEDHPVNREVVMHQLRLMGYAADAVANGIEALAALRSEPYGLLLTDCHMPEMDGFTLTARIREIGDSDHRLPIVALTANAMKDEAQRCLNAGMDDYLAKPVDMAQLRACLQRWLPARQAVVHEGSANGSAWAVPEEATLDIDILRDSLGDDPAFIAKTLDAFVGSVEEEHGALSAAINTSQAAIAERVAHRMKGASRVVGANLLASLCQSIECAAREADWQALHQQLDQFPAELVKVTQAIDCARQQLQPN